MSRLSNLVVYSAICALLGGCGLVSSHSDTRKPTFYDQLHEAWGILDRSASDGKTIANLKRKELDQRWIYVKDEDLDSILSSILAHSERRVWGDDLIEERLLRKFASKGRSRTTDIIRLLKYNIVSKIDGQPLEYLLAMSDIDPIYVFWQVYRHAYDDGSPNDCDIAAKILRRSVPQALLPAQTDSDFVDECKSWRMKYRSKVSPNLAYLNNNQHGAALANTLEPLYKFNSIDVER